MKISINWIKEILESDLDPEATAQKLTMSGTETEEIQHFPAPDSKVVVADVIETRQHSSTSRSELKVVNVWDGKEKVQVVCGAPNTPGKGAKVVFAGRGVEIKGIKLEPREFDGVMSTGMLCSEEEIGIGPDETGIIVLDEDIKAGTPLSSAFDLDDWVLDLSITPNRPDLLGHIGVAREIALLSNVPFKEPPIDEEYEELDEEPSKIVQITIEDADGCPRYSAAVVKAVNIRPSPLKMRNRLHMLGVRPISNAVDITNWILLLHNQPLHAFDLKRLSGGAIIVRRAKDGERIITLDGIDRYLNRDDLVIADKFSPVAIAGVMGGEGSQIEDYTKDILIECAYFSPKTIRKTSSKLNLSSESSYRFERGIDPTNQLKALNDSVSMMCRLTGGKSARGLMDVHPKPYKSAAVRLRENRVEKMLGVKFDWKESLSYLKKLGCEVVEDKKREGEASLTIPPFRPDLTREIDLIEEIARINGFEKIPSNCPVITVASPERSSYDLVRKIRSELAAGGFWEVFNLSIVGDEKQRKYFPDVEPVNISNPLSSERDVMRVSLIPGMVDNLVYATTWKEKSVRLFEVGTVFHRGDTGPVKGIVENTHIAAIAYGPRPGWVGETRGESDFFDVLGLLHHLCDAVWHCMPKIEKASDAAPVFLLPASACRVIIGDETCGWIGELHPEFYQRLELPRGKGQRGKVGIVEIALPAMKALKKKFSPMPSYPTSERDIAMIFNEGIMVEKVLDTIRKEGGDILESVSLFDIYRGKGIGAGKKSMAFSLIYRSSQATLKAEEVDALHNKIVSALEKKLGGQLR